MFRFTLAKFLGNFTLQLTKVIPHIGGTALPGLVALKVDPLFVAKYCKRLQLKSVVITGTNGKTTTARLITHALSTNNIRFIANRSGSNLLRGLASTLLSAKTKMGDIAIWETDEAAAKDIIAQTQPHVICFTNLFRDQLDRYGEINSILVSWLATLQKLKSTIVIVNADDPSLSYLGGKVAKKHQVIPYGLPKQSVQLNFNRGKDSLLCPNCQNLLKFSNVVFSHLGNFSCSHCHFQRLALAKTPKLNAASLPGLHNRYNLLASFLVAKQLGIKPNQFSQSLKTFKPAYGRGERFLYKGRTNVIYLVKNPTGYNSLIYQLVAEKLTNAPLLLALNDRIADGTDVSWIYDVDFNLLNQRQKPIIVTGTRAYDLALRLKLAKINPKLLIIKPNLSQALKVFFTQKGKQGIILPTYTAMLDIRRQLENKKIIHSSWKD